MHLVTVKYRTFSQADKEQNFTTLNGMKLVTTQLHATQIPPPRIYPHRYSIIEQADPDICNKEVKESKVFIKGLMTVGVVVNQSVANTFYDKRIKV